MRRLLSLIACGLLLAGCTHIPSAGPVETVPVTAQPRGVEIAPEPPQPGITPARLVEGFLQAMADPEADYSVARQYLAGSVRTTWSPGKGAVIYDGRMDESLGTVRVTGESIGTLDQHGRFTSVRAPLTANFGLVQDGGEWRIGVPPEGVLISRYIFERYYAHVTTYYLARAGDFVVPDLIHLPEALLTPSRIIESQIAGPSAPIADVVQNAVPEGTRLGPGGASVAADGTAKISLVGIPSTFSDERRRELGAQLVWSLTAIPRTSGLTLVTGDGSPIQLPGQNAEGVLELAAQQGYQVLSRAATTDLFGIRDGVAGRLTSAGTFLTLRSAGMAVKEVAVSLDGTLVAYINDTRRVVLIGFMGGELKPVTVGLTELRSAQFAQGMLWLIGKDQAGVTRLVRVDAQGRAAVVNHGDLPVKIIDAAISQTGARSALIVEGPSGPVLGMVVVLGSSTPRLSGWTPLTLVGPTDSPLTNFVGVDWSGEAEVAVIAEAGGLRSVFRTRFDGSVVEDLGPAGIVPVCIAALPRMGGDAVVVRSADNEIARYETRSRWTRLDEKLQEITYPG